MQPPLDPHTTQADDFHAAPALSPEEQYAISPSEALSGNVGEQAVINTLQDSNYQQQASHEPETVEWQASEYILHEKSMMWYGILALITVIGMALLIIFVHDWIFATLILVMAITVIVYARRPPRDIHYIIDDHTIQVNGIVHPFDTFRSFGIVQEEAFFSIQLIPMKRFRPAVVLFFAEQDGERIVDALGLHIPMQPVKQDLIEKFSRFIRF
jgi:hypothetical protein